MNDKEINHAKGLEQALRRKVAYLRQEAGIADKAKDGRSKMATRLLLEADSCESKANDLRAAIDAHVWLGDKS